MCVRFFSPPCDSGVRRCLLIILVVTTPGLRAERPPHASRSVPDGLATVKIVDVLNLFSNVGALIYFAEPNDFGIPAGIATHCSGTLIHERVFLLAGHCTAPTAGGLLPFIKTFVTFSPNALDRSAWLPVSSFAFHPSLPPCPPPEGCTFQGLDPGILDVGLVFLSRPVRHIAPARLAKPGTLETAGAAGKLMIVAGYGHLDSLPGGGAPPDSEWMDFGGSTFRGCRRSSTTNGRVGLSRNRVLWRFRSADVFQCSRRGGGKRRRRLLRTRLSGTCRYDGRAGLDTPDDRGCARSAAVTVDLGRIDRATPRRDLAQVRPVACKDTGFTPEAIAWVRAAGAVASSRPPRAGDGRLGFGLTCACHRHDHDHPSRRHHRRRHIRCHDRDRDRAPAAGSD